MHVYNTLSENLVFLARSFVGRGPQRGGKVLKEGVEFFIGPVGPEVFLEDVLLDYTNDSSGKIEGNCGKT